MADEDFETDGEYWRAYKEQGRKKKEWHQENTVPKDVELLKSLPRVTFKVEKDGAGNDRYVIEVPTDRGYRTVDWYTATGKWKVRQGRGEGVGVYRMARYFQLIQRSQK